MIFCAWTYGKCTEFHRKCTENAQKTAWISRKYTESGSEFTQKLYRNYTETDTEIFLWDAIFMFQNLCKFMGPSISLHPCNNIIIINIVQILQL